MQATTTDAGHRGDLVEVNPQVPFWAGPVRMWRNLREHRHIVSNFIQRDLRLKYRDSAFGFFWSLLEPLLLSAVYFVLFVIVAGTPQPKVPFWIIVGVITWGLFSNALTSALGSLTKNEGLIKQIYFPRELFAFTAAGAQLVLAFLSLVVAIPFMIYFAIPPTIHLVLVPIGLVLATCLALGIGLGFASLNVVNRDVEHLFKFVMRAGMFLSPVMWTIDMPRSRSGALEYLFYNPIVVPITMVRNGVDGRPLGIEAPYVAYSIAFCLIAFVLGAMIFKRYEARVVKKL
jgi:ABC-type polysaccharide/polyol phosphate export permease